MGGSFPFGLSLLTLTRAYLRRIDFFHPHIKPFAVRHATAVRFAGHQAAGLVAVTDEQQARRQLVSSGRFDRHSDLAEVVPDADLIAVFQAEPLHVAGVDLQRADLGQIAVSGFAFIERRALFAGATGDEDKSVRHGQDF